MARAGFRQLYSALEAWDAPGAYHAVVDPWLDTHQDDLDWLAAFAERPGHPVPPASAEDLWELYAVSRVQQMLTLGYQPSRAPGWGGHDVSIDDYRRFIVRLGMRLVDGAPFSPLLHEVVEVEQADNDWNPVFLVETVWPAALLGPLIFARGGVRVRAGNRVMDKAIAETSMLYWAYRRRNRACHDLSHGWGHNSQWRTDVRRDYLVNGEAYLNVDAGARRPNAPPYDEELLLHRCHVTSAGPHDDLWPYDLSARLPLPADVREALAAV